MTKIMLVDDHLSERVLFRLQMAEFLRDDALPIETAAEPLGQYRDYAGVILDWKLAKVDGLEEARRIRTIDPKAHTILRTGAATEELPDYVLSLVDYVAWKVGAGGPLGRIYSSLPVMRAWMRCLSPGQGASRIERILWTGPLPPSLPDVQYTREPLPEWQDYRQFDGVVITGPDAYLQSQFIKNANKTLPSVVLSEIHPSSYPPDALAYTDYVGFEKTIYGFDAVLRAWKRRFR